MRNILCGDVLYHIPNTLKVVVAPTLRKILVVSRWSGRVK